MGGTAKGGAVTGPTGFRRPCAVIPAAEPELGTGCLEGRTRDGAAMETHARGAAGRLVVLQAQSRRCGWCPTAMAVAHGGQRKLPVRPFPRGSVAPVSGLAHRAIHRPYIEIMPGTNCEPDRPQTEPAHGSPPCAKAKVQQGRSHRRGSLTQPGTSAQRYRSSFAASPSTSPQRTDNAQHQLRTRPTANRTETRSPPAGDTWRQDSAAHLPEYGRRSSAAQRCPAPAIGAAGSGEDRTG